MGDNDTSPHLAAYCSENSTHDELCDATWITAMRSVLILEQYLLPIIIFLGMIGNLLSFLVFCCTYLRRMSSSVYLAALSVSDFVFLVALFFNWINNLGVHLIHRNGWCQFIVYVTYVASFLSVWYVVCFTVERHLTVCFPLLRQRLCQPKRAKIVVLVVAILGLLVYNFAIWTSVVTYHYDYVSICTVDEHYYNLVITVNNIDTIVTLVVPALLITVSNVRISYSLSRFYRFYRTRRSAEKLNSNSVSGTSNDYATIYSNSSYNRLQMKITKMLLLVSSVFLLCNSPSHAMRVYAFVMSTIDESYNPSALFLLIQRLAMLLYYAGFSTNVVLYNVSGKTFRLAFVRLFRCLSHRFANFFCRGRCIVGEKLGLKLNDQPVRRVFRFQIRTPDCAYN